MRDLKETKLPFSWGGFNWYQSTEGLITRGQPIPNFKMRPIETRSIENKVGIEGELRRRLQSQIVQNYLEDSKASSARSPEMFLIHGGIASGKSSIVELIKTDETSYFGTIGHIYISYDEVKRYLPEFNYYWKINLKRGSTLLQSEAAKVGGKILKQAIRKRLNIIYEGTFGDLKILQERIRDMKSNGYMIHLISTHIPVSKAIVRARKRAKSTGRHVPEAQIRDSYKSCPQTLPILSKLVDDIQLFDNSFTYKKATPVFEIIYLSKTEVEITLNPEKYDKYVKRVGKCGKIEEIERFKGL